MTKNKPKTFKKQINKKQTKTIMKTNFIENLDPIVQLEIKRRQNVDQTPPTPAFCPTI